MEVVEIKTQQILMMSNLGETNETNGNLAPELFGGEDLDMMVTGD